MIIGIESDSLDGIDLRTLAEWTIRPRLLSISGVAQVTIIGGDAKEYQVLADPNKMRFYGVSMNELAQTARSLNENSSGGFINEYGNIYTVRGLARTNNISEIGNSVVAIRKGLPVRIKDIALVTTGPAPRIGAASYRGRDAVLVNITKQPAANTVKLTEEINTALGEIMQNHGSYVSFHTDIYNQAEFIDTSINNVKKAIIEGGIFVVIILFIFLMNWRTTAISLIAIPLSLLFSIIVLRLLGYTINTMSLGGMAIAIGSLVDDAIIDVENVYKHLRQNALLPKEKRIKNLVVIYEASSEIRPSILNATLIIIVTFIPLFFLEGFEGRMLKPLGISFIVSLFASLIVALTVTPVLCSYLLTGIKRLKRQAGGSWIERNLNSVYSGTLAATLKNNTAVLGLSFALLVVALVLFSTFGRTFLPPFNEGEIGRAHV